MVFSLPPRDSFLFEGRHWLPALYLEPQLPATDPSPRSRRGVLLPDSFSQKGTLKNKEFSGGRGSIYLLQYISVNERSSFKLHHLNFSLSCWRVVCSCCLRYSSGHCPYFYSVEISDWVHHVDCLSICLESCIASSFTCRWASEIYCLTQRMVVCFFIYSKL